MTGYSAGFIHYGSFDLTAEAVRQVFAQTVAPSGVVVVDNQGIEPAQRSELEALGAEVVSPGRNTGYAGGFNLCLDWFADSGTDALWVLNSDVTLRPDAAEQFLAAQAGCDDWDVMGSLVTQSDRIWFGGGAYSWRTGRATHLRFGDPVPAAPATPEVHSVDWINGCSLWVNGQGAGATRRADEHFFLYREELEWQTRRPPLRPVLLELPLVDHDAGAVTGGTAGGLGLAFMARNTWIIATRARGWHRLTSRAAWVLDYVAAPLKNGNIEAVRTAVLGVRLRHASGEEVVKEVRRADR